MVAARQGIRELLQVLTPEEQLELIREQEAERLAKDRSSRARRSVRLDRIERRLRAALNEYEKMKDKPAELGAALKAAIRKLKRVKRNR